ncbi:amino acid permease-domain-containing [Lecanosticta acicola]|uniref:Amino acid permease-domain-containing n=1 Tax=Lecanosticta acicola TaxID=111012 RepID=A0AAI8Z2T3_9PEZI|nr:amino acid permease-domain-containing [Lecanosticta acicola]
MAANTAEASSATSSLLSSQSPSDGYKSINSSSEHVEAADPEVKHSPADIESDVLPETSTLGRNLNWRSAYILTISRVLGSGIFATPGVILASVGSPGLSLALWVVGATLAYFGLMISLEYGCMLPRSGGEKVYLEFTFRRPKYLASILVATQAILLGLTASNCVIFAQYTLFALDIQGTEFLRKVLAVGVLTWITFVHACFMKTGIRIQNFLGWIKIGIVLFMILSGLFVVLFRPEQQTALRTSATLGPQAMDWTWTGLWAGSIWSWGAIATSIIKVFYSFAGLSNANNVLNEVKDPVRTLKSVSRTALATVCGMYALINVAYFMVVPLDEIRTSGELIAGLFFERVFGETFGRRVLPLLVALSGVGNVMVVTFALARLNQEIARTGLIPFSRILSSTAPFGSPFGGLIVHYIPSALVLTIPSGDIYSFILEVEGYLGQIIAFAVAFGLVWLRFKQPDLQRPYKAWLPGVFVRLVIAFALMLAPFFPSEAQRKKGLVGGAAYALVGIAVLLFGVLYWFVYAKLLPRWRGYRLEDQTELLEDGQPETYQRPLATHRVTVKDIAGNEDKYTLDSHGFQIHRHVSTEKDFLDDERIKDAYYKEVDQLLKDVTGATRTFIFDHTIRRPNPDHDAPTTAIRGPVKQVHIDQSSAASLSRVPYHLPEESPHLLQGRVQIINVWRPIKPIRRDPLAVAAAQSVSDADLVPLALIYEKRQGETLGVRYAADQEWFYKYAQGPEEVLLIKCFDNRADGLSRAKRVPHSAFEIPGTEHEEGRESIEVRCLVFHEGDVLGE